MTTQHVGCDTTGNFDACLRAASWETLAAAQPKARVDLLADLSNLFQVSVLCLSVLATVADLACWSCLVPRLLLAGVCTLDAHCGH